MKIVRPLPAQDQGVFLYVLVIFQKEEADKLKDAQARMEEAHQTKMEQLKETISKQHEQDNAAAKRQMENEMQEVDFQIFSILCSSFD